MYSFAFATHIILITFNALMCGLTYTSGYVADVADRCIEYIDASMFRYRR